MPLLGACDATGVADGGRASEPERKQDHEKASPGVLRERAERATDAVPRQQYAAPASAVRFGRLRLAKGFTR